MMNPVMKKNAIKAAMLESITAGNGSWGQLLDAVKATKVTKTMNGWTLRNCLQALLDSGAIYRVWFTDDEVYDLSADKPVHVVPTEGWTLEDALYKGDLVGLLAAAFDDNLEKDAGIKAVTCSLTGIVVNIGWAQVLTLADGTDISDQYWKALCAHVGAE